MNVWLHLEDGKPAALALSATARQQVQRTTRRSDRHEIASRLPIPAIDREHAVSQRRRMQRVAQRNELNLHSPRSDHPTKVYCPEVLHSAVSGQVKTQLAQKMAETRGRKLVPNDGTPIPKPARPDAPTTAIRGIADPRVHENSSGRHEAPCQPTQNGRPVSSWEGTKFDKRRLPLHFFDRMSLPALFGRI